jgi:peptidyl-prolyl cis-trans isomerase C
MRRLPLSIVFCLALIACGDVSNKKSGAVLARGDGVLVTADEFKARLDRQARFLPATTLARKKELLEELIRFEVLARAAEKDGFDKDPDVQMVMRQAMVQKFGQKSFPEGDPAKEISEPDARKFFDEHKEEFDQPMKVRLSHILVAAGDKDRAAKRAAAGRLLARIHSEEKKNPMAFAAVAREASEEQGTRGQGGDLGFRSQVDLEKLFGKAVTDAALALKDGQVSAVLDSPQGFHLFKLTGRQAEITRTFESARAQIQLRLYREKRKKDIDDFVKRLRDDAKVTIYEDELEKVSASAAPRSMPLVLPGTAPGAAGVPHPAPPPGGALHPAPPPTVVPAQPPPAKPSSK